MEASIGIFTSYLIAGIEAAAALVVGIAAVQALVGSMASLLRRAAQLDAREEVRLRFVKWLAIAIDFELAADILRTTMSRSWNDIAQLAAIIVIRTALNYFLTQETERAARRAGG
jgi:uncharacterized membrane protein